MKPTYHKTFLLNDSKSIYFDLEYNGFKNLVIQNWQGNFTENDTKKGYATCLEILDKTHCPNLINNCFSIKDNKSLESKWLMDEFIPLAMSKGVRCLVHVIALGSFPTQSLLALLDIQEKFNRSSSMRFKIFDSVEESKIWIQHYHTSQYEL